MADSSEVADLILREARLEDAAALAAFAERSFADTFGAQNNPADMAAYLAASFSPAIQAAEIADTATIILLAVRNPTGSSDIAGYAHLVAEGADMQMKRLYVKPEWKGRGLAARLLKRIVEECRRHGAQRLWLTVWTENPRAIAFYKKAGFRICGSEVFMVGDDAQTDHVMETMFPAY
jgi:diamine N-acetyltransferase